MSQSSPPAWITPGTKVVLYSSHPGHREPGSVVVTTITKVNKQSFNVESANEPRFSIDGQIYANRKSRWGATRHCIPFDSEAGRAALAGVEYRKAVIRAEHAVDLWKREKTATNRAAAIAALQALPDQP
ncbi:hypothetical protein [Amycolatopsis sp. DSM 110486]|uniref:hypothetical protein n=1 Tax=Amycolatopsis sp. DSM 110486 TaxID=2865832 RepID=UPI001C695EEB|nr:hypothetical protein [Amycolatopsis sp. DSM 110486]QYN17491.1 hypothetical protein K1T34_32415 [Amycolatopsis sp. DSM 110486]